jgi:tyrosinase
VIRQYWKQCQHGTWYFLPWHRGYTLAFEANIRAAVVQLGGPADWTLPYWNYFLPNQNLLPPAFASPDWPDGKGNNPLFVPQRYGPNDDGNVFVPVDQINLNAMNDPDFTGVDSGGSPGFGGVDTGFSHGGAVHGGIETQPHDFVHGLVGGGDPNTQLPGLMSDPDTAALDPIFWLHHANIDRLWQVWNQNPPTDLNPTDPNWVKGPGNVGERIFTVPMPGGVAWNYTPGDMADLAKLGYTYDNLTPDAALTTLSNRLVSLGVSAAVASKAGRVSAMTRGKNVELVGANTNALRIMGGKAQTTVRLDSGPRKKVSNSLVAAAETAAPDRVFLNLENVRGLVDADHPELLAGSLALFGVRKASLKDDEHAGQGLTFVLEITKIVDALHLKNKFDADALSVEIVPLKPVPEQAQISIGRVSIFRQGN